jgi:lysophospholipase L1-like esterase
MPFVSALFAMLLALVACAPEPPAVFDLSQTTPENRPAATQPVPRDDARHHAFLDVAKAGNIDILFVGDSITDLWRGVPGWNTYWAPLTAANFGIMGDTTQTVLWRMRNGELDGYNAKLIVLLLGVNNIMFNDLPDIAKGHAAIIAEFKKHQPNAKVLVLGVFPRDASPTSDYRPQIRKLNALLAQLADNQTVFFLDIGDRFLNASGAIPADIMPDGIHPSLKGYAIWKDAIADKVKELTR